MSMVVVPISCFIIIFCLGTKLSLGLRIFYTIVDLPKTLTSTGHCLGGGTFAQNSRFVGLINTKSIFFLN